MIDIVLGISWLCFLVKGAKRGVIRSVYHALNVLIAAFCAFGVYPVFGLILTRTPFKDFFSRLGYENAVKYVDKNVAVEEYIKNFDKMFTRGAATLETTDEVIKVITDNMGSMVCKAVAYFFVFIFLIFVANDILNRVKLLNKPMKMPDIVRKIGGGCFGVLRGIVILSVVYAVVEVVAPILDNSFLNWMNQSRLDGIFVFKDVIIDVLSRITYYNNI